MNLYRLLVVLHVMSGIAALVSFWLAAARRKGSDPHRTSGRAYLLAMSAVIVTGTPLAITAFINAQYTRGLFLTFLLTLTGSACWRLWRAVRNKREFAAFSGYLFRGLSVTNFVLGGVVVVLGWEAQNTPMLIVGTGGVVFGVLDYRLVTRGARDARWWLSQHIAGVMGAGFATHVTFMSLGLLRVMPENAGSAMVIAWTSALAGALTATIVVLRRYGRRSRGAAALQSSHAA